MLEYLDKRVKNELEVIPGEIRDPFSVNSAVKGCDAVFHLASLIAIPYSYKAPMCYVETNVQGAVNVMQSALEHDVQKLVHTSTSEVYGSARYTPINEAHSLQAQSPYSASKIAADKVAESFRLSFDLPIATIRPFNTYGPRQSARAVIPTIVCQALAREEVELGLLTPVRDLTFVEDTVDGFVKMAECDEALGKVINIGAGRGVSIGKLADTILSTLGIEKSVVGSQDRLRPPDSEVMNLVCDNQKAKEILGWQPQTSLEDGLQKTIEFYRSNLNRYKADRYVI
jgi:NAD dependent epimerase/dehydratase